MLAGYLFRLGATGAASMTSSTFFLGIKSSILFRLATNTGWVGNSPLKYFFIDLTGDFEPSLDKFYG
jgi:hypothetical protein